jgi:hypothetical protein
VVDVVIAGGVYAVTLGEEREGAALGGGSGDDVGTLTIQRRGVRDPVTCEICR